ncbi:DMT family transporter [Aminobacter carboxidus]|uniref:DMT family transporter n=1 Tax=Aminobacter carboxidus TaxID=376165 RepID=A0A8E2BB51_9HYPH|nr:MULTISPECIES: DMT family transporter [Aminobacter carboxidus group]MBB6464724.1 transporter family-2 protein [Aminobacter lissarensis]MBE1206780.1 DMT family transporter [Aminobacter carboxidus]
MPNFGSSLLAAALVAGAAIPFQAGANAMLGRLLGHPLWATMVSLAVSVALAVPVMLAFKVPMPAFAAAAATGPWWVWIGGAAGVVYVTAALLLAPKMGAASFIVAVIGGQMMASLVIDHFGLMGFVQRPASMARVAGLVLIVAGLVVTQWASAAKAG